MSATTRKHPQSAVADLMQARFPKGTFKRMDRLLRGGELRTHFVRTAVEAEMKKREAALKRREPRAPEPLEQEQQLTAAE